MRPTKGKRWRRILLITGLVLVAVMAIGWLKVRAIDRRAHQISETGQAVVKLFKDVAASLKAGDPALLQACLDEDHVGLEEGGVELILSNRRDGVETFTWQIAEPRRFSLHEAMQELLEFTGALESVESSKLKLAALEELHPDESATVRAVWWLRGREADGRTHETFSRWRMTLRYRDGAWLLSSKQLIDGETVRGSGRGFANVTEQAGIGFVSRRNPEWTTPEWTPHRFEIMKYAQAGVSVADYDNDGWADIFFGDGLAPRLYRNSGGMSFEDVTLSVGLPETIHGASVCLFADFDNDGWRDLFVGCSTSKNRIYRNHGGTRFERIEDPGDVGGWLVSTAAISDYDCDGDLDIYVGRYLDPRKDLPTTLFYTRNGAGNSLLRNEGNFRFTDVTEEAGVREGGLTLALAWGDYDEDGDPDLYVANDFGRNALFQNGGDGTFQDVAAEAGALDIGYGMSADFSDIDNDGDLDLYVSNVHSGQRWYGHSATLYRYLVTSVRQATILEDFSLYKEMHELLGSSWQELGTTCIHGNSLFLNEGGKFREVSELARCNPFGWYWASAIFDYDGDGRQDIYAVNGWITGKRQDDL